MDNYIGWKEDTQVFTQFNSAKKRKNAAQGDIFFDRILYSIPPVANLYLSIQFFNRHCKQKAMLYIFILI